MDLNSKNPSLAQSKFLLHMVLNMDAYILSLPLSIIESLPLGNQLSNPQTELLVPLTHASDPWVTSLLKVFSPFSSLSSKGAQ